MLDKNQIWQSVLAEFEVTISRPNFLTWFQNTFLAEIDEEKGEAVIGVPNNFTKEWLEKKYHKFILETIRNLTDNKIKKISYRVQPKEVEELKPISKVTLKKVVALSKEKINSHGLNPRYTFDTFVVGKNNELAYTAAKAVANNPGKKYNPLFIYGGVGLGKTHLLQAIGHEILRKNPDAKIFYVSAEKFANDFIKSIRKKEMGKFRKFYRKLDVLLVDDIQFIAGKGGTQEEFFHTFNDLYQMNKQIVITSDRLPKAIPALEERLISRFEWGLIADISSPDYETRLAILEEKCKEKGQELSRDILQYLATHIQKNVRELEGALNRIYAYHQLNNVEPTLESVKHLFASLTAHPKRSLINDKDIIKTVADFYGISVNSLIGTSRQRELVIPRQIAMYLMREELNNSFPLIGRIFGGRDHTTVMHAYQKIKNEIEQEGRIKQEVEYIKERLYNQ